MFLYGQKPSVDAVVLAKALWMMVEAASALGRFAGFKNKLSFIQRLYLYTENISKHQTKNIAGIAELYIDLKNIQPTKHSSFKHAG